MQKNGIHTLGIQYSLWSLTKQKLTQGNILCPNQVKGALQHLFSFTNPPFTNPCFTNPPCTNLCFNPCLQIHLLQIHVLQIHVLQIHVLQIHVLQLHVLQLHVLQNHVLQIKSNPVHVLQYMPASRLPRCNHFW